MALLIALCFSASLHAMTCNHSVWAKYPVFFFSKFHDSRVMANILKGVDNWVGLQNYCFLSTSSRLGPPPPIHISHPDRSGCAPPPPPLTHNLQDSSFRQQQPVSRLTSKREMRKIRTYIKKKKDNKDELLSSSWTESENRPFFSPPLNVYEEPKDFCYPFPTDVLYQCRRPPNSTTSQTIIVGGGCGDSKHPPAMEKMVAGQTRISMKIRLFTTGQCVWSSPLQVFCCFTSNQCTHGVAPNSALSQQLRSM